MRTPTLRGSVAFAVALCVGVACTPATHPTGNDVHIVRADTQPPALSAPAAAAPPTILPMPPLEPIACRADSRTIYPVEADDHRLCDAAMERCFLAFDAIQPREMRLSLGRGDAPATFVEIVYGGMWFRGYIATSDVLLFPAKELYLGGFFRARALTVTGGRAEGLRVTSAPGPHFVPVEPLRAEVACDAVSWSQDTWTPPDEIARMVGARGPVEHAKLAPRRVPLSNTPGGATVATIDLGDEGYVDAYQAEKNARFIVLWLDSGDAFGWVPRDSLAAIGPPGTGSSGSSGSGRGFAPLDPDWRGHRCRHDVRILAHVGGVLLEAGSIPAQTVFSVGAEIDEGLLELRIRHPMYTDGGTPPELRELGSLRVLDGATLALERRELRDCERGVPSP